jgi:hypothetical protein
MSDNDSYFHSLFFRYSKDLPDETNETMDTLLRITIPVALQLKQTMPINKINLPLYANLKYALKIFSIQMIAFYSILVYKILKCSRPYMILF